MFPLQYEDLALRPPRRGKVKMLTADETARVFDLRTLPGFGEGHFVSVQVDGSSGDVYLATDTEDTPGLDPDDDHVLSCAPLFAGQKVDFVVSEQDGHFLHYIAPEGARLRVWISSRMLERR